MIGAERIRLAIQMKGKWFRLGNESLPGSGTIRGADKQSDVSGGPLKSIFSGFLME